MRKYLVILASLLAIATTFSSCVIFRRHGPPQYRQAPPPKVHSDYNRRSVKTKVKYRNYKNQYRSDYRGNRGGRDPYHSRNKGYRY